MKIFGIVGWSGSGKTTLMVKLLPELTNRGFKVSTMKHSHHSFEIDRKGKDSFEHRKAGASEVLVCSSKRWALMHELRGDVEPSLDELIAHMSTVDLLLIEGFKAHKHDKLEIYRESVGLPLRCIEDKDIVAVACDNVLEGLHVPVINLNETPAIVDFIIEHCGLKRDCKNV